MSKWLDLFDSDLHEMYHPHQQPSTNLNNRVRILWKWTLDDLLLMQWWTIFFIKGRILLTANYQSFKPFNKINQREKRCSSSEKIPFRWHHNSCKQNCTGKSKQGEPRSPHQVLFCAWIECIDCIVLCFCCRLLFIYCD